MGSRCLQETCPPVGVESDGETPRECKASLRGYATTSQATGKKMSNSTGAPSGRYYEWLAAVSEQQKLPARILASCQVKALWIIRGHPADVKLSHRSTMTVEDAELFRLVEERLRQRARGLNIPDHEFDAALKETETLPFAAVLKMASLQGFFESVMPEVVLVMDVMRS